MKKRTKTAAIIAVMLILVGSAAVLFTACSNDNPAIGFWIVDRVTAGEVVMNETDAKSIGLNAVGTIKLQKSGNCEVVLLGEEAEGKWKQASDGTITITYGDNQTLTGSIDKDEVMTLLDPQGSEYILTK